MPIPETMTWPPEQLDVILPAMRRWDAWYAGRTDRLEEIYKGQTRPTTRRDGVVGAVQRWFWGSSQTQPVQKVHAPIAARICRASADLLFAEPPTVTSGHQASQERLDLIIGAGAHDQLASAAEVGAALGGTYMRVAWDQDLVSHPFLTRVDADHALPEFTWGRLSAVTFWRTVRTDGATIWRHLERHETQAGIGVIEHALFRGNASQLGRRVSLTEATATAGLADDGDGMGAVVSTLSAGLDVVYVPNVRPNSAWRDHPLGANLGRSDLDGIEGLLDQYDQAWTSWMRDVRLGKARIIASQQALDDNGPGRGASLDLDREVYEAVSTPPGAANTQSGMPLEQVQFKIRVQEHKDTADALLRLILLSVGYSASTFGMDESGGGAMTATEVHSRERDSFMSRDRKIRAWRPALAQLATKALAIDRDVFRSGADPDAAVAVEFGDTVQESQEALASTAQALFQAQSASTRLRVQMIHPDWDDATVDEEVDRIRREFGEPAPDPDALGRGGFGLGDAFGEQP